MTHFIELINKKLVYLTTLRGFFLAQKMKKLLLTILILIDKESHSLSESDKSYLIMFKLNCFFLVLRPPPL